MSTRHPNDPRLDLHDLPEPLGATVRRLHSDAPSPEEVDSAADRVRERLRRELAARSEAASETAADAHAPIRGCEDYQRLLPAYLAGELPEARALLVEDHTRECIGCRRALMQLRNRPSGAAAAKAAPARRDPAAPARSLPSWLPMAAGVLLVLATVALLVLGGSPFGPARVLAEVASVDGALFELGEEAGEPPLAGVLPGAAIVEGQRIRTGKTSGAVVRLEDGSLVELSERAEMSLDKGLFGTTIRLGRGRIIVQAADQGAGRLHVATGDCKVAVKGTIFSVNHGVKGSRVSVIEGEVEVRQRGGKATLLPGQQTVTDPSLEPVPLAEEISWSRDTERYLALLSELRALEEDIRARVDAPEVRHDSRLLDVAPAGTVAWAAIPNLGTQVSDAYAVLQERLATSPVLASWWQEEIVDSGAEPKIEELVQHLSDLGSFLGDEIAVAVATTPEASEEDVMPVALAEVTGNAAAFEAFLAEQADRLAAAAGQPVLVVVDGSAGAAAGLPGSTVWVWTDGRFVAASPDRELLAATVAGIEAGGSAFADSAFAAKLREIYAGGVEWLGAGDVGGLIERTSGEAGSTADTAALEATGFAGVRYVMVERHERDGLAETGGVVTFDGPRRGLASWLAEPGPMGALEYVSADAHLATAFVVKDASELLSDLFDVAESTGEQDAREESRRLGEELGIDIDALAAAVGGEFAFAVDGPVLPTPSWRLVLEVYDPVALQGAFETLVEHANRELTAYGQEARAELVTETDGDRVYYTLRLAGAGEGPFGMAPEIHYTYADGYLVAGPTRVMVDRGLATRASGNTLTASSRFRELLPEGGDVHFSAVAFQGVGELAGDVSGSLRSRGAAAAAPGNAAPGDLKAMLTAAQDLPATLAYAWAEEDEVRFAAMTPASILGLDLWTLMNTMRMLPGEVGATGGAS